MYEQPRYDLDLYGYSLARLYSENVSPNFTKIYYFRSPAHWN